MGNLEGEGAVGVGLGFDGAGCGDFGLGRGSPRRIGYFAADGGGVGFQGGECYGPGQAVGFLGGGDNRCGKGSVKRFGYGEGECSPVSHLESEGTAGLCANRAARIVGCGDFGLFDFPARWIGYAALNGGGVSCGCGSLAVCGAVTVRRRACGEKQGGCEYGEEQPG